MTTIRVAVEQSVTRITLSRPEARNAINSLMVAELSEAFAAAEADAVCRVVTLEAEGRAFCAGMDLKSLEHMTTQSRESSLAEARALGDLLNRIWSLGKPVIALVRGPAIGGGCGLAVVCDITLATPEASFGFPEVRIGIVPALVSVFLSRAVGQKAARELLLTGRRLTAAEALEAGLLQEVVPDKDLNARATGYVNQIVANSPAAVAATKRLVGFIPPEELERASLANAEARATPDCREGIRAFFEKRPPNWQ